jgi:hypothetical protein
LMYKRIVILTIALLLVGCHRLASPSVILTPSIASTSEVATEKPAVADTPIVTLTATDTATPQPATLTMPVIEQSFVISQVTRLEVPWLGPVVDVLGFTLPMLVGDIDGDARNELLISLSALDYDPASQSYDPDILITEQGSVKAFAWDGADYVLEHLLPVEQNPHFLDIAQTSSMALLDWDGERVLIVGSSRGGINQNGYLSIVTLRDNVTQSLLETLCLGSVYHLSPVELDGALTLFVSSTSNYDTLISNPELALCQEHEGVFVQTKIAMVMLNREPSGFVATLIEPEGYTLLLERLPDAQGELYHIVSDWSGETPVLRLRVWQDHNFSPTDILPDYRDKYVVQMKTADVNGDGLEEVLVFWGLTTYRPKSRWNFYTVRDMHLDIYQWQSHRYQLVWRHELSVPVWSLATGDLDNDAKDEIIFGAGLVLDLREGQYIEDNTLADAVDELGIYTDRVFPRFLVADTDNDGRNEIVMLADVGHQDVPEDVWVRIVTCVGDFPPEEAYKAPLPDTGVYYAYVIELKDP